MQVCLDSQHFSGQVWMSDCNTLHPPVSAVCCPECANVAYIEPRLPGLGRGHCGECGEQHSPPALRWAELVTSRVSDGGQSNSWCQQHHDGLDYNSVVADLMLDIKCPDKGHHCSCATTLGQIRMFATNREIIAFIINSSNWIIVFEGDRGSWNNWVMRVRSL